MSMMNRFRLRPAAAALFVGSALLLAGCGQAEPGTGTAPASAGPTRQRIAVVLAIGRVGGPGNRKRRRKRNRLGVAGGQRQRR